jgi:serine/threonine protein kinase
MQAPLFINHPNKQTIFEQFAAFVYQLHQHNIFHRDLSPGNILIKQNFPSLAYALSITLKSVSFAHNLLKFLALSCELKVLKCILLMSIILNSLI